MCDWVQVELDLVVRRTRFKTQADGAPEFNSSDIFLMNDGGRPGNRSQLISLKSGDDAIQKTEKTLTATWQPVFSLLCSAFSQVVYDEESIMKRRERMKGGAVVKQVEFIYVLMPPSGARVMKKKRRGAFLDEKLLCQAALQRLEQRGLHLWSRHAHL